MSPSTTPTGAVREVGIADIFFSVTDRKGVIKHANQLFVDFAKLDWQTLSGAPHSIIRHPEMPAGVFYAMWSELLAGHPFAGHITNLAADGSAYSVYATVTPLGDDSYLSVRIRPMDEASAEFASAAYAKVADYEAELRQAGIGKRSAAEQGANRLLGLMSAAGHESVSALQRHTLPREIARLERRAAPIPERPGATGEVGDLLIAVAAVNRALTSWTGEQHRLATLSESLRRIRKELRSELESASSGIARLSELACERVVPKELVEPLAVWTQMQELIATYIDGLLRVLHDLDTNGMEHRFRVALAKLHTRMLAAFAAEIIDNPESETSGRQAAIALSQALRLGLSAMIEQSHSHADLTARSAATITRSVELLAIPRELLLAWRHEIDAVELPRSARRIAEQIADSANRLGNILTELRGIVDKCSEAGLGADPAALRPLIARVEAHTEAL
ncbi:MAG: hypothetical protein ACTH30_01200 [Leucobacter sp.]